MLVVGPSNYNDDKGIKYRIEIEGWPTSRRTNARRPIETKYLWHHEDKPLGKLIINSLDAMGRSNLMQGRRRRPEIRPQDQLEGINFVLHGAVPHKHVLAPISTPNDFNDLVVLSRSKKSPDMVLRFVLTEPTPAQDLAEVPEEEGPPKKKAKKVRNFWSYMVESHSLLGYS